MAKSTLLSSNLSKNEIFKLNLIYKMITLLYQKSTKLTLKNVLFFIKAHILFFYSSLFFLFFFFLKALIHDLILLIKKTKTSSPLLQYNYAENFFRFLFNYRIHGSSKA
ncbi:hypothetical protein EPC82_06530 [Helicobacter pylori]|nr:hypothetical protein EPC82_06530 [Helicobacter pylori]